MTEKESGSRSGTTSSSLVQNTINLLTSIKVADGITLLLFFKSFLKKMLDVGGIVLGFLVYRYHSRFGCERSRVRFPCKPIIPGLVTLLTLETRSIFMLYILKNFLGNRYLEILLFKFYFCRRKC